MRKPLAAPAIALVYDQVTTGYGGAEVVLEQLHLLYPTAPLFTTVADTSVAEWAKGWQIRTSFLQTLPSFLRRRHQWQAVLAPIAIETLDLTAFDIIISVTAGAAKGIITRPDQLHVCYLLTPTRYLYEDEVFAAHKVLRLPGIHWLAQRLLSYLRWWDIAAAQRPDRLIAISRLVAARTKKYYHKSVDAIIYPPFRQRTLPQSAASAAESITNLPYMKYDLIISRLVWYKRVDLAIAAALQTQRCLVIVGDGASLTGLLKLSGAVAVLKSANESLPAFFRRARLDKKKILFCRSLNDTETSLLLAHCRSLLMLGQEDFGMTALEAMSFGKPVIIDASSGVAEVLANKKQAVLLPKLTVAAVVDALAKLDTTTISPALLKRTALRYSDSVFRLSFAARITKMWQQQKADYGNNA